MTPHMGQVSCLTVGVLSHVSGTGGERHSGGKKAVGTLMWVLSLIWLFFRRAKERKKKPHCHLVSKSTGHLDFTLLSIFYFYSNPCQLIPVLDDWKSMCLHIFIFSWGLSLRVLLRVHACVTSQREPGLWVSRTGTYLTPTMQHSSGI